MIQVFKKIHTMQQDILTMEYVFEGLGPTQADPSVEAMHLLVA
jgi:hypothetical protein